MSGSGISWATCKSAHRSRQTTTPAPHHSVFYRPDALPAAQPTASKHWRHLIIIMTTTDKKTQNNQQELHRNVNYKEHINSYNASKSVPSWKSLHTHTHIHPFNGHFSRTTRVSRYQKGKTNLDFSEETVSGSGISWVICKSAPRYRQITMPAAHHSSFYRPDALPVAQPTA